MLEARNLRTFMQHILLQSLNSDSHRIFTLQSMRFALHAIIIRLCTPSIIIPTISRVDECVAVAVGSDVGAIHWEGIGSPSDLVDC